MKCGQPTIEDLERQLEAINAKLEPLLNTRDYLQERIVVRQQELNKAQIGLSPQAELTVTQEFIDFLNDHRVTHWGWELGKPCGIYGVLNDIVAISSGVNGNGSYVVNVPAEIVQRMALADTSIAAERGGGG